MSGLVLWLSSALLALTALAALPALTLALQVLAARLPVRPAARPSGLRPRLAVLVPAHDEEQGIAATLAQLRLQLETGDRLLVVADNCGDDTAGVAARAGAEVAVRHEPGRRGKGYALDHGMKALAAAPPEVVVVIDADCSVMPGCLRALGAECMASGQPVQALYLMRAPQAAGLRARIGAFAWLLRNQVRPSGMHRLGLPCQLMGSGMAFPFELLSSMPLASGHIVEDLKLGLDLAVAGSPPRFCPEAVVTSMLPLAADAQQRQRARWEQGHLSLLTRSAPRLLALGLARRQAALVALALDLGVPPLGALVVVLSSLLAAGLALGAAGGAWQPAALAAASLLVCATSTLLAWAQHGRALVSLSGLLMVPVYVAAKLPIYASWLAGRSVSWVRTRRDAEASTEEPADDAAALKELQS